MWESRGKIEKPPTKWIKMNVDACLDSSSQRMGFGIIIRNANGMFVAAKEIPWHGAYMSKEAQEIGVHEAIKWLKELENEYTSNALQVLGDPELFNGFFF